MKILHTSDWHIGHRLLEQSQQYEQERFFDWLLEYIRSNSIDILLVAGDIFDTAYPSSQSMTMFYDFLGNIVKKTDCQHIVITAGNHDSPGTLEAPKELVKYFSINMIGKADEDIKNEILKLNVKDEKAVIAAVPYLRDRDIRLAVAGEDFDTIEKKYRTALIKHYWKTAGEIEQVCKNNCVKIAMGHLFAIGAEQSDSEQRIYAGGLGDIAADDFPETFDYIALGHLHQAQKVGGKEHIRYSGSPIPYSFGEAKSDKKVIVIETANGKITNIENVDIPLFRDMFSATGSLAEIKGKLENINGKREEIESWVEIILDNDKDPSASYADVNTLIDGMRLKVLNVKLKNTVTVTGLEKLTDDDKKLNDLQPLDVFEKKCQEEGINLREEPELLDAFNEILNLVNETE